MINILIATNFNRKQIKVSSSKTIKQTLKDNNIDYTKLRIQLNGITVTDLNKSFKDYNTEDYCLLTAII